MWTDPAKQGWNKAGVLCSGTVPRLETHAAYQDSSASCPAQRKLLKHLVSACASPHLSEVPYCTEKGMGSTSQRTGFQTRMEPSNVQCSCGTSVHVCMHLGGVYIYMYTCMHVRTYVCRCVYIYIYICIHMHACTHVTM